jgi:hypothetical protein
VVRGIADVIAAGVRAAGTTPDLRRLFAAVLIAAVALVGVEVLWQPRFTALLGGVEQATRTFGYVVVAMSLGAGRRRVARRPPARPDRAAPGPGSGGRRATMVSVQSLCMQGGNAIASLTLTRLAQAAGVPVAWAVGAGLLALTAGLLWPVAAAHPRDEVAAGGATVHW